MFLRFLKWLCGLPLVAWACIRPILLKIPFINSIFDFSFECHWRSVKKFFVLWFSATSPVILAFFFAVAEREGEFKSALSAIWSLSESLVYTAAFIPPFLYLIYERYSEKSPYDSGGDGRFKFFRKLFEGYWLNFLVAMVVLVLSVIAFTIDKVADEGFKEGWFFGFLESLVPYLYVFSLYCWYLTILDSFSGDFDFVDHVRAEENQMSMKFKQRLARG